MFLICLAVLRPADRYGLLYNTPCLLSHFHKDSRPWQGIGLDTLNDNGSVSSLTSLESNHSESETAFSAAGEDMSDDFDDLTTDEVPTGQDTDPATTYGAQHFAGLDQSLFDLDDGDEDDVDCDEEEESASGDEDDEGDDDSDMYL